MRSSSTTCATAGRPPKSHDNRSYVERLAEKSKNKEVRNAAGIALDGDNATFTEFIGNGQYQVASEGMRVAITRAVSAPGPILTDAGRKSLTRLMG
ncbi:hypothetical protein ACFRMN_15800 [Streptomyces sp. NPDC056835]|uniref:hypothetical protein n=1 Tax=Streptomyces sp. NPDC056835 TaxID=3345956 RepID=UPI0036CF1F5C